MNAQNMKCAKHMYFAAILSCVFHRISGINITSRNKCCDEGVHVEYSTCRDGKKISIVCDEYFSPFYSDHNEYGRFIIANDSVGEYMDVPNGGYIIREPNYCVGTGSYTSENGLALACFSHRIRYNELAKPKQSHADSIVFYFIMVMTLLNVISTVALLVTTFVYCFLREMQDTQGKCIFHVSLNMCLMHAGFCYMTIFSSDGILPNACITNWYLLVYLGLSTFGWCAIVGHNSWTQAKADAPIEDDSQIIWYRYFGYGFPAVVIFLCNLFAHAEKLYTKFEFELECYNHQTSLIFLFIMVPILTFSIANCYFFFDTRRQLRDSPILSMRCEKSTLQIMMGGLAINGKLFIITGGLWSLSFVCYILHFVYELSSFGTTFLYCLNFLNLLISAEGIFIFLVLVVFRKRVLKGISRHPFIKDRGVFPEKWKTMKDSEIAMDSEDNCNHEEVNNGILRSAIDVES